MKRLLLIAFIIILSGCALLPHKLERPQWPSGIASLTGEGDVEATWAKEHFSGPFIVKMDYPGSFLLEVYGAFGQTLMQVKKEDGQFLLVAGDEKTTDEAVFEKRYGFSVSRLMDDLSARGPREETPDGWVMQREGYIVRYGQDRRGRRKICWEGQKGSICLTFDRIDLSGQ